VQFLRGYRGTIAQLRENVQEKTLPDRVAPSSRSVATPFPRKRRRFTTAKLVNPNSLSLVEKPMSAGTGIDESARVKHVQA
jgi:hypothetical protein